MENKSSVSIGQYLNYFGMGKDYLRMTQKEDAVKEKMDGFNYIQLKTLFLWWA